MKIIFGVISVIIGWLLVWVCSTFFRGFTNMMLFTIELNTYGIILLGIAIGFIAAGVKILLIPNDGVVDPK